MISGLFVLLVLGGIGFGLWSGAGRMIDPAERASLDAPRVLRSVAIAIGMYLAMLAITVGFIDLFQALAGGDRLAGSNSDLARALALLIVGAPTFGLLARIIDRQQVARRAEGDGRAAIGWSAHFVAATTTTLIGVLVSCAQIIDDVGNGRSAEANEVAQLAGWLVVWLAYWFALRPRLGVRGHLHLLVGSVIGLGWLVAGIVGLGIDLGDQAYAAVFADPIVTSSNLAQWLLIGLVGAAVWFWHWRILDRPVGDGAEPRPRYSGTWYMMVVGAGVVPALIALLSAVGGALTGTLIWFLGSPGEEAVEWFDEAPAVAVVGLVALAVWAAHRWLLVREGDPARNDAFRFHDYVVAGVALIAVVSGIALAVSLVLDALTADSLIASSFDLDNRMIGTLVLLAIGCALWWRTWSRIERSRTSDAVAECGSIWRKLYLIVAAGLGGLILAGCLIWILFVVLRDLFDGQLGRSTIEVLAGPIGWAIAVLAGVWFHIGVWRADRVVLDAVAAPPAASTPPPPSAPSGASSAPAPPAPSPPAPPAPMVAAAPDAAVAGPLLRWATPSDHGELFTLQRAAFVDEAVAYDTPHVPPLTESFADFQKRSGDVSTLVMVDGARILGAVSVRMHDDRAWLERLMVAPDRRNEKLGHALVTATIRHAEAVNSPGVRAVVGDRNPLLISFYESCGFEIIGRTAATDSAPELLVMEHARGR